MMYSLTIIEFKNKWAQFLKENGVLSPKLDLLPSVVAENFEIATQSKLEMVPIPGWGDFESCRVDWTPEDFSRLMGIHAAPSEAELYLVTDEGYGEQIVFLFKAKEFFEFAAWYSGKYEMDFFQTSDYLLFGEDFEKVRIIHHNGFLFANGKH